MCILNHSVLIMCCQRRKLFISENHKAQFIVLCKIQNKFYISFQYYSQFSETGIFFYRFCMFSYLTNTVLNCVGINDGKHSISKQQQLYLSTMKWDSVNYFNIPKNVFSFTMLLSCFWQNDMFKETLVIISTYCIHDA